MPRPSARRHSLRYLTTTYTQLDLTRKSGFAIHFYVRVLTQVQSSLCSNYCLHLVGYLYSNRLGFPLTFTEFLAQSTNTTQQTFLVQRTDVLWQPHIMWIVLWSNATSSVFFTVSHQNGISSSIPSASNLCLVSNHNFRCLIYLCSLTAPRMFWAFFWTFVCSGSFEQEKTLTDGFWTVCQKPNKPQKPKLFTISFGFFASIR